MANTLLVWERGFWQSDFAKQWFLLLLSHISTPGMGGKEKMFLSSHKEVWSLSYPMWKQNKKTIKNLFGRSCLIQVERSLVLIEKCPSWDVPVFQPAVKEASSFGTEQCAGWAKVVTCEEGELCLWVTSWPDQEDEGSSDRNQPHSLDHLFLQGAFSSWFQAGLSSPLCDVKKGSHTGRGWCCTQKVRCFFHAWGTRT